MKRISYFESERMCEATFLSGGCWWHLYTPGNLTSLLFADDDDYRFAMNLTARCIAEFPALKVVAFEIMSNHLHIVLCGDKNIINEFFTLYRKRLKRYLSKKVQGRLSNQFQMSLKPINDLKALREAIVYVNRNGYVVNPSHTHSLILGVQAATISTMFRSLKDCQMFPTSDSERCFEAEILIFLSDFGS